MNTKRTVTALGLVLTSSFSLAAGPTVIFSDLATSASSLVPGVGGLLFTSFDRPFVSPDGNRWIFTALTNSGSTATDEVIILGGGNTSAGAAIVLREGATFFDAAISWTGFDTTVGVNNAGHFAFTADTTAATTVDEVLARWNGSAFDIVAREGTQAVGQAGGIGYGSTMDSVTMHENGTVSFRTSGLTGATTQQVLYNLSNSSTGTVLAQTDITVPGNQQFAPDQSIDNFALDDFRSNGAGTHNLYRGDLNGSTTQDFVVVYDNNVQAQEGAVLPGSGFSSTVASIGVDPMVRGNHFMFRGSNGDGMDWVVHDGNVVARTDAPIFVGASELFDDTSFASTFFVNTTNSLGDYVIGGTTNALDASANAVLVFNGTTLIAREGDAVDVNGNGLFDDDAFISVFNNDDSFLTDDLRYFFTADLRNGAGTTIGQAFMVKAVPEPATLAMLGLGCAALLRRRRR